MWKGKGKKMNRLIQFTSLISCCVSIIKEKNIYQYRQDYMKQFKSSPVLQLLYSCYVSRFDLTRKKKKRSTRKLYKIYINSKWRLSQTHCWQGRDEGTRISNRQILLPHIPFLCFVILDGLHEKGVIQILPALNTRRTHQLTRVTGLLRRYHHERDDTRELLLLPFSRQEAIVVVMVTSCRGLGWGWWCAVSLFFFVCFLFFFIFYFFLVLYRHLKMYRSPETRSNLIDFLLLLFFSVTRSNGRYIFFFSLINNFNETRTQNVYLCVYM